MKDFLLNKNHLDVLNHINNNKNDIFHKIHRDLELTYSNLIKNTKSELILYNLITIKKSGRSVFINLTDKGKEVVKFANELNKTLEEKG